MTTAVPFKVQIFETPMSPSNANSCGAEWTQHGSCCNEQDLARFIGLEERLITLNDEFLTEAVTKASVAIGKGQEFSNFKLHSANCWNHIKQVRSSALCSICSGRSELFFSRHGKAWITLETCVAGVESCLSFFAELPKLDQAMNQFAILQPSVAKSSSEYKQAAFRLRLYFPPASIVQRFAAYSAAKRAGPAVAEVTSVCAAIMNIRKAPYILLFNPRGTGEYLQMVRQETLAQLDLEKAQILQKMNIDLEQVKKKKEKGNVPALIQQVIITRPTNKF